MPLPPPNETARLPRAARSLVDHAVQRWRQEHAATATESARAIVDAVADERLQIAYQPLVQLSDQRLIAFEALVRFPDPPDPTFTDPAALVAVAEDQQAIHALGTYVLVASCAQLAAWRRHPDRHDLQIHVNVSPLQLRDEHTVSTVERALTTTRIPGSALVLEVTETAAFAPDGVAEATLSRLDALGVEVAIDDFGTGFASLDLLAATPARAIKLDRSFVASVGALTETPRGRALVVQAAIGLGRALGMRVVAEGIETSAQARTLEAWGCVYGQGYHFARPKPAPSVQLDPVDPPRPAAMVRPSTSSALPPETIELGLAVATVLTASAAGDLPLRADALQAALAIGEALGVDRTHADVAAVLATIVDAPQRITEFISPRSPVAAAAALGRALMAPPRLAEDPTTGTIAGVAHQLAMARRDDEDIEVALARVGVRPQTPVDARLRRWWQEPRTIVDLGGLLRTLESRLRRRDEAARRLRSLSALTRAVSGGGSLIDVLEVTAEEARAALGAASVSISRIERHRGQLRTLVNVGDLARWEQRRPTDELYALSSFPDGAQHLFDRAIQIVTADPEGAPEQRLLIELDKGASAAVPVVVDGATWGEVYTTTHRDAPPFTAADTPFLRAVANVIALAVGRTEHVDELTRLADEDPLTRLPNRRALERYLTETAGSQKTGELGLLLLDIVGLSTINEQHGHSAGDAALVTVGDVLNRVAVTTPRTFAARLGGDEFCLAISGSTPDVEHLVDRIRERLADGPQPRPEVTAGYATIPAGSPSPVGTLLRRADAAQYLAARTGAPLVAVDAGQELPAVGAHAPARPGGPAMAPDGAHPGVDGGRDRATSRPTRPSRNAADVADGPPEATEAPVVAGQDADAGAATGDAGVEGVDPTATHETTATHEATATHETIATHEAIVGDEPADVDGPTDDDEPADDEPVADNGPSETSSASIGAEAALHRWSAGLHASIADRLEALADATATLLDLNRWSLSINPPSSEELRITGLQIRRRRPNFTEFVPMEDEVYDMRDYPLSASAVRRGGGFSIDIDDPSADPTERALLHEFGQRYLVAVGVPDDEGGGWLLELYGDDLSRPLDVARPMIEALAARTLGYPVSCP